MTIYELEIPEGLRDLIDSIAVNEQGTVYVRYRTNVVIDEIGDHNGSLFVDEVRLVTNMIDIHARGKFVRVVKPRRD